MKNMKKILSLFLVLGLCLSLFPTAALAEGEEGTPAEENPVGLDVPGDPEPEEPEEPDEPDPADDPDALPPEDEADLPEGVVATGTCGDALTWTLTDDGVLTIEGSGDMTDYASASGTPWYNYRGQIETVILPDGITRIGDNSFSNCAQLAEITIPGSAESIGKRAFVQCDLLETVIMEEGVANIGNIAFSSCPKLSFVSLPSSLRTIGDNGFQDDSALTSIVIPGDLSSIGYAAFARSGLNMITFQGNAPDTIGQYAFLSVTATAYYPGLDPTWTESIMQQYNGTITWEPLIDCDLYILGKGIYEGRLSGMIGNTLAYSYDPDAKILHLNGYYNMQSSDPGFFLMNRCVDGLTIRLDGNVILNGPTDAPDDADVFHLVLNADTTITSANGTSYLQLNGGSGFTTAISVGDGVELTLDHTNLQINGVTYGLLGGEAGSSSLYVRNGTTAYIRSYWGAVVKYGGGISWDENIKITEPENWTVNDDFSICNSNGSTLANRVRFDTVYDLTIDGVPVTEDNRSDVLGNGVFSFDGVHTLTLHGSYTGTADVLIDSDRDSLVVEGYGVLANSADADTTALLRSKGDLILGGTLFLRHGDNAGDDSYGILMEGNSRLSVQGTLNVNNVAYGLAGSDDGREQTLWIYGADVTVNSFTAAASGFDGGVTVEECSFVYPAYTLVQDGALKLDSIWGLTPVNNIQITSQEAYDLIIDGTRVYAGNKDDIRGVGVFSYDPASNTLTVSGTYAPDAVYSGWSINKSQPVIDSSIFGLTILVAGDTTLRSYLENYSSYTPVIQSIDALTIKGASGSATPMLRLGSTSSSVSYNGVSCNWLGVENVDLRIGESGNLPRYGFFTENTSSHGTLRFQNACAEILTMSDGAAATGYSNITLTDCDIVTTGVTVSGGAFVKDGSPTTYVVISNEVYDLYVLGQRLYGGHLEGSFYRYDPQSKTLYLNGSGSYTCSSLPFIENHIDDLTIYVESDIRLTTIDTETSGALIESNRKMTIRSAPSGEASLKRLILDGNGTADGILMDNSAYLILDEANVFVHSVRYGLLGKWTGASLLNITNSYLDIQAADGWAAVYGFTGGIVLLGCYIYTPYQAKIGDGIIYQEDMETYATEVLIVPNSVSYIVSFDMQGHGAAPAAQTIPNGECAREPAAPEESGWIFGGWYTDPECTTPFDFSTPVTAHLTLYAKWTQTYELWLGKTEVTAENAADILGDGTASYDPATQTLRFTVVQPNIRDLLEHEFLGTTIRGVIWCLHDLNIQTPGELKLINHATYGDVMNWTSYMIYVNGALSIDGDLTIDCDATYGISCDGLTVNGSVSIDNETYSEMDGALIICNGDLHINGDFDGVTRSTYGLYFSPGELRVDGDVRIRNSHSSGWGVYGGLSSSEATVVVGPGGWDVQAHMAIGANTAIEIPNTHIITAPDGGKVKQFTGYCAVTEADGTTIASHVVVEPIHYHVVSFDARGHGITPAEQMVADGGCAAEPEPLTEEGWLFGGWYTDTECTTPYNFSTPVTGPLTLYAKWTQTGYDLWICDTQVTVLNKDDVLGDGNIRFDPETNVLTVNGTYSYTEAAFIRASMDMTLTGTAQLTGGYDYPVIDLSMNTLTLDGAAELTLTGSDLAAVYTRGLTVDGGSLTVANGSNCAILCDSLILNSGSITATACCTAIRGVISAKTGTVTVNGGSLYARNTWGPDMYRYSAIDVSLVNCNGGRLEAISKHAESSAIDATSGFTIAETQAVTTPAGGAVNQITSGSSSYYTVTEADGTTPATHVVIEPKPTHTPGDINGDGKVNNKDVTRLQKYLKGEDVEVNAAALDVNGDGKVNNKDITRLQRYLRGEDVEIH